MRCNVSINYIKCERCGHMHDEENSINADDFGYSNLCEDCADSVVEYDDDFEDDSDE